jgi:putative peptidoglycan lipid II flippase
LKPKRSIFTAFMSLTLATLLLRLFSFFREVTLAAVYGAGMVSDAFILAFTIPDIILLLLGSSLASSYIPLYTKTEKKSSFTNNVLACLTILGLLFSVIFTLFPQALVYLFASQLDSETFALTVKLVRAMVWSAIPILLANILKSYLQIKKSFFVATISRVPISLMAILAIVVSSVTNAPILMAYGVVIGHIIYIGLVFGFSKKHGYSFKPYLNIRMLELRELLVLMLPVFFAAAITDINTIINRNFASSLTSGSVSALNYSSRIIGLITGLIGASAASVLFPRMSELSAEGSTDSLKRYLSRYVEKITPILLPLTMGIMILAEPIVRILFERGSFTTEDTIRTAECLRMYALMCLPVSISSVLGRAFHAMRDTKSPAVISAISVVVGISLNMLLIKPMQHSGLALSSSIAALVMVGLLLVILRKRLGCLGLHSRMFDMAKAALATLISGGVMMYAYQKIPIMSGSLLQCVSQTCGLALTGIGCYILLLWASRSMFLKDTILQLKKLLKR